MIRKKQDSEMAAQSAGMPTSATTASSSGSPAAEVRWLTGLVQSAYLQLDKAVVAGKTGRTARHLRCQSTEVKVVGVRT